MKRILAVLILSTPIILLAHEPLRAQNSKNFGLRVGIALSDLSGNQTGYLPSPAWVAKPPNSRLTLALGGFYILPISQLFSLQPEILATEKGAKNRFSGFTPSIGLLDESVEILRLVYVEIPVLLTVSLPTWTRLNPKLFAGPTLSFKIYSENEVDRTFNGQRYVTSGAETIKIENSRNLDFGFAFGGSVEIKTIGYTFILDLRYTMGLQKVFYDIENYRSLSYNLNSYEAPIVDQNGQGQELKNRALTLSIGIPFPT